MEKPDVAPTSPSSHAPDEATETESAPNPPEKTETSPGTDAPNDNVSATPETPTSPSQSSVTITTPTPPNRSSDDEHTNKVSEPTSDPPPVPDTPHLSVPDLQHPKDSSSSSSSSPTPSRTPDKSDTPIASSSTAPSSTRTSLTGTDSQSASGSTAHGHSGILRSPTLPGGAPSGVTFAPLPQLEQRKRNSTVPLGIAARSRLLRARRLHMDPDGVAALPEAGPLARVHTAGLTVDEMRELEMQQQQQQQQQQHMAGSATRRPAAAYTPLWHRPPQPEVEERMAEDDAVYELGRMIKSGAKTLWRRVSHSQLKEQAGKQGAEKEKEGRREKMHVNGLRRSLSEPRQRQSNVIASTPDESLTVSVLVKEPAHLFPDPAKEQDRQEQQKEREKEKEEKRPQSRVGQVEAVKVTEHMHGGVVTEEEMEMEMEDEEEEGRVWDEVVDGEVTRRMEELVRAQGKEKKMGLVGRIKCFGGLRPKKAIKQR